MAMLATDAHPVSSSVIDGTNCEDGFSYRSLHAPQDVPGVCHLFETVFHQSMSLSHWDWKYQQAPGSERLSVVVERVATSEIVGHMGMIIVPGLRAGQPLRMGQICDVMLHPQVRAGIGPHGMYQRMHSALRSLAHAPSTVARAPLFMYGFPGTRPAVLGERVGLYRRMQICTEYVSSLPVHDGKGWSAFWARNNPWRLQALPQPPVQQAWSDTVLDGVWQRHLKLIAAQPQLDAAPRIVKNAAYLRWRYLHHPMQQQSVGQALPYTLWLLRRMGFAPIGWLITRRDPHPVVVDSCLPPEPGWAEAALQALPAPRATSAAGWISWLAQANAQAVQTPIRAVEALGQPFHPDWPSPQFQPGDTDVF